jgi:hypothetical protein
LHPGTVVIEKGNPSGQTVVGLGQAFRIVVQR